MQVGKNHKKTMEGDTLKVITEIIAEEEEEETRMDGIGHRGL